MKNFYFLMFLITSSFFSNAQIVNIPDLNFKNRLIELGIDINDDGEIQISEAEAVSSLGLNGDVAEGNQISSFEGIQSFTNLSIFYCNNNLMTELDLSQNTQLVQLYCLNNHQLTNLDLSVNVDLETLFLSGDNFSDIDLTDNENLLELLIQGTNLTSLDLTENLNLELLSCSGNQLTELDVSQNSNITELDCSGNQLMSLDCSQNINLQHLYCSYNELTELDLSQNLGLLDLDCSGNQLTDLDLNNLANLSTLDVSLIQFNSLFLKNGSVLDIFTGFNTSGDLLCIDDNQAELDSLGDLLSNFQNVTTTCDDTEGTNLVSGNVLSSISTSNDVCSTNEVVSPLRFDVMQNSTSVYDFLSTAAATYITPIGLGQGDFVIVPTVAYTDGLVVNPAQIDVSFAENIAEMVQQDLCMEPRVEIVDGIEIEFFPSYVPDDPFLYRFDAYIILTNTTNTDYNGELRLNFDGDYTAPFDYDYFPSSELDNEVIWDNINVTANGYRALWLRIGYNTETDPEFPVMEGDELTYNLFLTESGTGGRSVDGGGDPIPDFRMIETIMPSEETLHVIDVDYQNSDIKVFPNPTNGIVNITHHEAINQVSLFSINGQLVYRASDNSESLELDLSNLNQGIYFISVNTNSSVYTKKVIKR